MNNPLVSIIVPVFNSERFLKRCIDSILAQKYRNLEIILVDDGSTDGSSSICDYYSEKYNNIRVYHTENNGVSSARNKALDEATGEYIAFLDSDDTLDEQFLCVLVSAALENDLDIVRCQPCRKYGKLSYVFETRVKQDVVICNSEYEEEIYKYFGRGVTVDSACFSIIKARIAKKCRFDKKITYGEDTLYMIEALNMAKKCMYVSKPLYYYYYHTGESTESSSDEKIINNIRLFKEVVLKKASKVIKQQYLDQKLYDTVSVIVDTAILKKSYIDYINFVKKLIDSNIDNDGRIAKTLKKNLNKRWYFSRKMRLRLYMVKQSIFSRIRLNGNGAYGK